jgi:hypothetical protein
MNYSHELSTVNTVSPLATTSEYIKFYNLILITIVLTIVILYYILYFYLEAVGKLELKYT